MRVSCYEAVCRECGSKTSIPLLSEFSYGDFIARGREGRAVAYLNAFDEPAWEQIDAISRNLRRKDEFESSHRFQYTIGRFIDKVDGEELSIIQGPICPVCQKKALIYNNLSAVGEVDIPDATFIGFWALSEEERKNAVRQYWTECPWEEPKNRKFWSFFQKG